MGRQLSIFSGNAEDNERRGEVIRECAVSLVENLGPVEVSASAGMTLPALKQALSGGQYRNMPADNGLLPTLLHMDEEHRLIRLLCDCAGGDFTPRRKRDPERLNAVERWAEENTSQKQRRELKAKGLL